MSSTRKYPRTRHLPWSPGATPDDLVLADVAAFEGRQVVVTEKRDGENTTIYPGGCHARSIDSVSHLSRTWVASMAARVSVELPKGWRICGENLYAMHSIYYTGLRSYFEVFSIWDGDVALSWSDTLAYAEMLDLVTVPVLYEGTWPGEEALQKLWSQQDPSKVEGYVVRLSGSFRYDQFDQSVAKYVRRNHVNTDKHWMHKPIVRNELL